ncbi:MAG: prenyltransferase/squalene oxidase repeat-containing protein, partial [Limisphaerales bacterium]
MTSRLILALAAWLVVASADAQTRRNLSLKLEVKRAIDRGSEFLLQQQNEKGWWSDAKYPALTALPLTALHGHPEDKYRAQPTDGMHKAYQHLLSTQKDDGGFYVEGYANYNTAVTMMGLLTAGRSEFDSPLRTARGYLVGLQNDLGVKGKLDTPYDGGIGYGRRYPHSDLNNSLLALEAIYHTRHLVADAKTKPKELDWSAAISFLQNCQNLPSHNKGTNVASDAANLGGFHYYPGFSQAGNVTNSITGRVSLRSYGSASYAGLLSYVYADLNPKDPRVTSVLDWLGNNYTLTENPGMGQQGLYYYFQLITKALTTANVGQLTAKDGTKINWRTDLTRRIINLQNGNGSWDNENNRWWETD